MTRWLDDAAWGEVGLAVLLIYLAAIFLLRSFCYAAAVGWREGTNDATREATCDDDASSKPD